MITAKRKFAHETREKHEKYLFILI